MSTDIKLPSFLIIGAQKAGTTSLHHTLDVHPKIFMSKPKELYFFDVEANYERGVKWYASFFKDWTKEIVAGESNPDYLWHESVPARMVEVLPNAKLIILLRNPANRAYSSYWYSFCGGSETLPFEEALEAEPERATQGRSIRGNSSYVERGLYARQIKRYFKYFDRSQFLILLTEEFKQDPKQTLSQVTDFLEVSCDSKFIDNVKNISRNVSRMPRSRRLHSYVPFMLKHFHFAGRVLRKSNLKEAKYPPMSEKITQKLSECFRSSNAELEELLGRKLDVWNQ